jgi:hypothetical protein
MPYATNAPYKKHNGNGKSGMNVDALLFPAFFLTEQNFRQLATNALTLFWMQYHDVRLVFRDGETLCHSLLLSSMSPFLRSLLQSAFSLGK